MLVATSSGGASAAVVVTANGAAAPSPPQVVDAAVGEPVAFRAVVTDCPEGGPWIDHWDFGDRTAESSAPLSASPCSDSPRTTTHTFGSAGTFTVVYGYQDCGRSGASCQTVEEGTVRVRIRHPPADARLAGFSIAHSESASTCSPTSIDITALDRAGKTLTGYVGRIVLSTSSGHGDWDGVAAMNAIDNGALNDGSASYTFATADNGSIRLALSNAHADDLMVTVGDPAVAVSATAGPIAFRDNAFVMAVSDPLGAVPVAGRPHAMRVELVRRDSATGCGIADSYAGNRNLKLWMTADPLHPSGALAPVVAGTAVPPSPPAANNISLSFSGGSAEFLLAAADIGRYTLNLRDDARDFATGMDIDGGSPTLTVRPFGLRLDFAADPTAAGAFAADATGSVFKRAGEPFTATVTAVAWQSDDDLNNDGEPDTGTVLDDNPATPSFGRETTPETIEIEHSLIAPAGGSPGTLDGGSGATFAGGSATVQLRWTEVGIIALTARLTDNDYLASGVAINGRVDNVGRFRPARFQVTANVPSFRHAQAPWACEFTYWGQPFAFQEDPVLTVTALNTDGGLTTNYGGDFWKLSGELANRSYRDSAGLTVDRVADGGAAVLDGASNFDGAGTLTIRGDELRYAKPVMPQLPYPSRIDLDIAAVDLTDGDGVCHDVDLDGTCDDYTVAAITGTEQRYGRLAISNGYGSELRPLDLPVRAGYWRTVDGAESFAVNGEDNCTTLTAADISLDDYRYRLNPGESIPSVTGLLSGASTVSLSSPGQGNDGSVRATVEVEPWLQYDWNGDGSLENPAARATFGIYRGSDRVIYRREVFN